MYMSGEIDWYELMDDEEIRWIWESDDWGVVRGGERGLMKWVKRRYGLEEGSRSDRCVKGVDL